MKRLGVKFVRISAIVLPGDIKRRQSAEHVKRLAESFEATGGILAPPVIEWKTKKLVAGADRLAALLLTKPKPAATIQVEAVEGTAEELRELQIVENLRRRNDDKDSLLAELRRLKGGDLTPDVQAASPSEPPGEKPSQPVTVSAAKPAKSKGGRGKKTPGLAAAAKTANTTEAAVKQAEYRARKKEEAPEPAPPVELRGLITMPAEVLAACAGVKDALTEIDRLLIAAKTKATKLFEAYPELVERFGAHQAKAALGEATMHLRGMTPAVACVYCGCVEAERPRCPACKGSGWLTEDAAEHAPKALDGTQIYVGGELVKLQTEAA